MLVYTRNASIITVIGQAILLAENKEIKMKYRLINYHGSEFAIMHKDVLVFRSYSLDKIHAWFKKSNVNNYQIG